MWAAANQQPRASSGGMATQPHSNETIQVRKQQCWDCGRRVLVAKRSFLVLRKQLRGLGMV